MKILFYIEPHCIRANPLEFSWIAYHFLKISNELNRYANFDCRIFSNNNIKTFLEKKTGKKFDFLTTFEGEEQAEFQQTISLAWAEEQIEIWLEVLNNEGAISKFYNKVISRIHNRFPFDVCICWGNSKIAKAFCEETNSLYISMEQGPLRHPFFNSIVADFEGVNGEASTSIIRSLEAPTSNKIFEYSQILHNPEFLYLLGGLPKVAEAKEKHSYCLIGLQLPDDTNQLHFSRFKKQADFVDYTIQKIREVYNGQIIIKPHPKYKNNSFNLNATIELFNYIGKKYSDVYIYDKEITEEEQLSLLVHANFVVVDNSSLGFEAALLGKPVVATSDQHYGGRHIFDDFDRLNFDEKNLLEESYTLLGELINSNLYLRSFALSACGIQTIINQQYGRARAAGKVSYSIHKKLAQEEGRHKVKPYLTMKAPLQSTDRNAVIRKIKTAVRLFRTNKVLFLHEIKRRLK